MAYSAKILKDSVTKNGARLTTFEVTFGRYVLSEFNTHKRFSRNSASSRAIPVEKMLKRVMDDPFIPPHWGKNQKGMQASEELTPELQEIAKREWLLSRDNAVRSAKNMLDLGVHKQISNRLLEPWSWQTVIVTATEYENFFALRNHADAAPEIQVIAEMMETLYRSEKPTLLNAKDWHLPLTDDFNELQQQFTLEQIVLISVGRCARVSYLTHDGKRDPIADIELANRLLASGHMSPFEHVARPMTKVELNKKELFSNFEGWVQYRKLIKNEDNFRKVLESRKDNK